MSCHSALRALRLTSCLLLVGALAMSSAGTARAAVSDQAHGGGVKGFVFLPPIVDAPDGALGALDRDPKLLGDLEVAVYRLTGGKHLTGDPLRFTSDPRPGGASATLRAGDDGAGLIVNLHTRDLGLDVGNVYRAIVRRRSNEAVYGFADIQICANARDARALADGTTFGLVDGRTLPLKFAIAEGAEPVVPRPPVPAATRVAWKSSRDGNPEIYSVATNGAGLVRVTSSVQIDQYPSLSADGARVAWTSQRDGNQEVYVASTAGTEVGVVRITDNPALDAKPSFSADGRKVAWQSTRDDDYEIYVASALGTESEVVRITDDPGVDVEPSLSADGSKVAWQRQMADGDWEILVASTSGTNVGVVCVSNDPSLDQYAAISGDGRRIVWQGLRDGNYEIYAANTDGTGQIRVTSNPQPDHSPSLSYDGGRVAWVSQRDGNYEIYAASGLGTELNVIRVTSNPAADSTPSIGLDGSQVTWVSRRDGNNEVYIGSTLATETAFVRLSLSSADDSQPCLQGN